MTFIPYKEIENMTQFIINNELNTILKAKLSSNDNINSIDITDILINLSNFNHLKYFSKDIYLGDTQELTCMRQIFGENKEINNMFNENNNSLIFSIKYSNQGIKHKFKCLIDKSWRIVRKIIMDSNSEDFFKNQEPHKNKPIENLFFNNENIISLNHFQNNINKENFIVYVQNLPMINFFLNSENNPIFLNKKQNQNEMNFDLQIQFFVSFYL